MDGGSLPFEFFPQFQGMTDDEINSLTTKQFEDLEDERMERNAWQVAQEVADRIEGAPVLKEFMKSFLTPKVDDQFFFNKEHLDEYFSTSSVAVKKSVPRYNYIQKIEQYYQDHFETGKLYMEFLRGDCCVLASNLCSFCASLTSAPRIENRVPRPMPDPENPGHYFKAFDTPTHVDGKRRSPDDFMPGVNIKKLYNQGKLRSENEVQDFALKFAVDTPLVEDQIKHHRVIELKKSMRQRQTVEENQNREEKTYADYDWGSLIIEGWLKTLRVAELNKYLNHHKLLPDRDLKTKDDKMRKIIGHFREDNNPVQSEDSGSELSDSSSEEEEYVVSDLVSFEGNLAVM